MKVSVFSFGCKVNQYESQLMRDIFSLNGYQVSENGNFDLAVINSCCVTSKAEKHCRNLIKKLLMNGKEVWLTGCWIKKDERKIKELFSMVKLIDKEFLLTSFFPKEVKTITRFSSHTRAFIKIEDGCENFCSYCIIPYVRGKVKSRNEEEIILEVKNLSENGYSEFVFTGVNLGVYGSDTDTDLVSLLQKIFSINKVKRVRLSSIELFNVSDELIDFLSENEKFCPHFHIPLQSGSDRILKLMKRKYTVKKYLKLIEKIKKKLPSVTFTTDVMVGFPGEEESDFEKTCKVVEKVGFLKVHVFPFSVREGTSAERLQGVVAAGEKKERVKRLLYLNEKVSKRVKEQFIGTTGKVLVEKKEGDFWYGYSLNYLNVLFPGNGNLKNKIVDVHFEKIKENYIVGRGLEYKC